MSTKKEWAMRFLEAIFVFGLLSACAGRAVTESRPKLSSERLFHACVTASDTALQNASKAAQAYCGYFLDRYPFFELYDSPESFASRDVAHALTVRYSECMLESGAEGIEAFNGELVGVRGVFFKDSYETFGLAKGRIDGVERIETPSSSVVCSKGTIQKIERNK